MMAGRKYTLACGSCDKSTSVHMYQIIETNHPWKDLLQEGDCWHRFARYSRGQGCSQQDWQYL